MDNESEQDRDLESFFSELGERLDLVAEHEASMARFTAPRFNLFSAEYIGAEENKITTILRDLLDTKGSHGQGPVFLERFLKLVGFDPKCDLSRSHARDQHRTSGGRYVDLTVQIGKCILGLENKINAREEVNQMHDYIAYLRSTSNNEFLAIFLTPRTGKDGDPTSCEPGEWDQLRLEGRARSLSYSEFSAELSSWATLCKSERVRVLLLDMSEWAQGLTEGDGKMANDATTEAVKQFVVRHKAHVKTCLAVVEAAGAVKSALIIDFAADLETGLRRRFDAPEWSVVNNVDAVHLHDDREPSILLRNRSWGAFAVGIAANTIKARFGYGVKREGSPMNEIEARMLKILGAGKTGENPYFWYRDLPRAHGIDLSEWLNHETLKAMQDDEIRAEIIRNLIQWVTDIADVVTAVTSALSPVTTSPLPHSAQTHAHKSSSDISQQPAAS